MSHRALVVVAREDGYYDVYYSHDGGADDRLAPLRFPGTGPLPGLVEGTPIASGIALDSVMADHLDPIEHEALLVVERDGGVVPFVVLPFVLATADGLIETEPRGVAFSLPGRGGSTLHPAYVRGWFQGTADVLGGALDAGLLPPEGAFAWLEDAVRRLAGERHTLEIVP